MGGLVDILWDTHTARVAYSKRDLEPFYHYLQRLLCLDACSVFLNITFKKIFSLREIRSKLQ